MDNTHTSTQTCTSCGANLPKTREYFGNTPSGGFRRKCRSCMSTYVAQEKGKHPEQATARSRKRAALLAAAPGAHSEADIAELRSRLRDCCAYCGLGLDGKGELDHMTPLSKGGSNSIKNITLACWRCNGEKHSKSVKQYFSWRLSRKMSVDSPIFHETGRSQSVWGCTFALKCTQNWDSLDPIAENRSARHCGACNAKVYFCDSEEDLVRHADQAHCVSLHLGHRVEQDISCVLITTGVVVRTTE